MERQDGKEAASAALAAFSTMIVMGVMMTVSILNCSPLSLSFLFSVMMQPTENCQHRQGDRGHIPHNHISFNHMQVCTVLSLALLVETEWPALHPRPVTVTIWVQQYW